MSRGLAIIATDVGAITDVVSLENGIIISPNDVENIKVAIEDIINMKQKELLMKKKKSLYHVKNNFNWLDLGNQTIQFIETVIK